MRGEEPGAHKLFFGNLHEKEEEEDKEVALSFTVTYSSSSWLSVIETEEHYLQCTTQVIYHE